jgi:methylglutamate dehydrogenase subunit D
VADDMWTAQTPQLFAQAPARDPKLTARQPVGLTLVMARRGQAGALADACRKIFGAAGPARPLVVEAGRVLMIWSGPDQFLVLGEGDGWPGMRGAMGQALAAMASLSDQESARMLLTISGHNARQALSRLISIDLDPDVFPVGAAAATSMEHLPVNLWRAQDAGDGAGVFHLLVPVTYAASLAHALEQAAAQFA